MQGSTIHTLCKLSIRLRVPSLIFCCCCYSNPHLHDHSMGLIGERDGRCLCSGPPSIHPPPNHRCRTKTPASSTFYYLYPTTWVGLHSAGGGSSRTRRKTYWAKRLYTRVLCRGTGRPNNYIILIQLKLPLMRIHLQDDDGGRAFEVSPT